MCQFKQPQFQGQTGQSNRQNYADESSNGCCSSRNRNSHRCPQCLSKLINCIFKIMALAKINQVTGSAIHVPGDDIDTDRIIPARFMKCVTFDGLGEYLFHDVRFDDQGNQKDHALNDVRFANSSIMLSGKTLDVGVRVSTPHNHYIELDSGQLLLGILRRFSLGTQLILESPAYRWIPIIELSLLNGSSLMQEMKSLWMLIFLKSGRAT